MAGVGGDAFGRRVCALVQLLLVEYETQYKAFSLPCLAFCLQNLQPFVV